MHAEAPAFADTDWAQIAGLYEQLLRHDPSPVVALNRAVAVGFAEGPEAGPRRRCPTIRASSATPRFYAARYELLRRTGDADAAAAALDTAIALTANEAERDALRNLKTA